MPRIEKSFGTPEGKGELTLSLWLDFENKNSFVFYFLPNIRFMFENINDVEEEDVLNRGVYAELLIGFLFFSFVIDYTREFSN